VFMFSHAVKEEEAIFGTADFAISLYRILI
jgi:hypothetical protein